MKTSMKKTEQAKPPKKQPKTQLKKTLTTTNTTKKIIISKTHSQSDKTIPNIIYGITHMQTLDYIGFIHRLEGCVPVWTDR